MGEDVSPVADSPLVEASDVTVRHDGQTILERVSLSVAARSIHMVIGPNGAGKSSLLAALLGQISFSGAVRYHWRGSARLGFVPQSFAIDRTLPVTVAELLALPRQRFPVCLGVRRATRARVESLLARVGLRALADRRVGALSGGELRRVLLANALDPEPELILLDEPGSGLDPESTARMEETLAALRESAGTTVLMVSHDRAQVRRLADRVTLLDRSVRRTGTAEEVLAEQGGGAA
jgi:zinc transport system ATP-binding protein